MECSTITRHLDLEKDPLYQLEDHGTVTGSLVPTIQILKLALDKPEQPFANW